MKLCISLWFWWKKIKISCIGNLALINTNLLLKNFKYHLMLALTKATLQWSLKQTEISTFAQYVENFFFQIKYITPLPDFFPSNSILLRIINFLLRIYEKHLTSYYQYVIAMCYKITDDRRSTWDLSLKVAPVLSSFSGVQV